jgi:ribonuclease HI
MRAGAGIFYGADDKRDNAIGVPNELGPSNRVAEMLAVKETVEDNPENVPIDIISDSKYTIEGLTKHPGGKMRDTAPSRTDPICTTGL